MYDKAYSSLDIDKGHSSLDVAIKLDLSFQEAESYKIDYWKHRRMYELEQIYREKKDSLPLIISKLDELEARNISLDLLSQGYSSPQYYASIVQ